jgi:PAS domain S-box-containing protein
MPATASGAIASSGHFVQFYEEDPYLLDSLNEYVDAGFRSGEPVLVIATGPHREALEARLTADGVDVASAIAARRYVPMDAADTLSRFMVNGRPDPRRFDDVVGRAVRDAMPAGDPNRVRAFGEMVGLLWAEGNRDAALQLERLWNDLSREHDFSLLCAYAMSGFGDESHGQPFLDICGEHSRVIPAESYTALENADDRLRNVSQLQQKASSFEAAQRRETQKALARREEELSDFLENAAEGLHKVGPDGRILWANRAELALLGYSAEEYVGHPIAKFHVDPEVIEDILASLMRGETVSNRAARLRCKDGSVRHVLIHANGYWEDGRFVHSRCFTRDVTERIRLEEELHRRLAEQAEADHRKDEFLAMLGHELRNPLSPIVTALQVMRLRPDDAEATARARDVIERQTQRMTRLVDELLDVSRIMQGKVELREEPVALASVVQGAVEQARRLIDERGHHLVLDLPGEPIALRADAARLEQVLANLLLNAAKYTDVGGRVTLTAERERDEVRISVRDNGVGLPPESCDRIFDLFVQGPDPLKRAGGGLGVGLTLVRRLVHLHGGTVEARSEGPGKGSEFVVRLPLRKATSVSRPGAGAPAAAPAAIARRILVVDDNEDAAEGLAEFLRVLGHHVRMAFDGATALEEAERHRPEVAFLDIAMPKMDGYEIARRLRSGKVLESTVLVALTGFGQESDRQLAQEAGFDHHLVKPIDVEKVRKLLETKDVALPAGTARSARSIPTA